MVTQMSLADGGVLKGRCNTLAPYFVYNSFGLTCKEEPLVITIDPRHTFIVCCNTAAVPMYIDYLSTAAHRNVSALQVKIHLTLLQ